MAGLLDVPVYRADESRPDLVIPARPEANLAKVIRSVFASGDTRTRDALITLAVLVAMGNAVVSGLRIWLELAAGAVALFLTMRLAARHRFSKRQREFEPYWLDAQSAILRSAAFEVVRFGVQESPDPASGAIGFRTYDLARGSDVARLLQRQAAERDAGRSSNVRVDFAYSRGPARHPALETVQLSLVDLPITVSAGARRGRIRFPAARYHAEPRVAATRRELPSRTTFWVLGPAVLSAVQPQATAPRSPIASSGLKSGE